MRTGIASAMVDYPIGDLIAERVRAMGVKPFYKRFKHDGARGPNMATVYSDRGHGVRGPVVFYNRANEAAAQLKPGDFDWNEIFGAGVRWFHSGGIFAALSDTTSELIIEAMQAAKAHGAVVSFDLNYREKLWSVSGSPERAPSVLSRIVELVDVLVGNEEDLQKGLGIAGPEVAAKSKLDPGVFVGMIDRVVEKYPQIKVVATTLREVHSTNRHTWGAVAWIDGQAYLSPMCELDVHDRVGGGDGFAAGVFYGLMSGETPEDAVKLGWAHGALITTFPGDTTMATLDQVRRLPRAAPRGFSGRNAFDAGVASLLAGGVLEQDLYSLGGEALVLVYPKKEAQGHVDRRPGLGAAGGGRGLVSDASEDPSRRGARSGRGARGAACRADGAREMGHHELRRRGGAGDRIRGARLPDADEHGPRDPEPAASSSSAGPGNQNYWLKPDGSLYMPGETIKLPATARTLQRMVEAERAREGHGRAAGIVAARDRFYKGDIAREMVAFLRKHEAPFDASDFAEYFARVEEPARTTYRGYTVYKHAFGSQGPVLLQTLNILENFDLHAMGYASADYLHTVVEALKLAYADRDSYYADPAFVKVPAEGLLSKAYAKERAALIDPKRASTAFIAGDPLAIRLQGEGMAVLEGQRTRGQRRRRVRQPTHCSCRHSARTPRRIEGHDAHGRHRQGRQHL